MLKYLKRQSLFPLNMREMITRSNFRRSKVTFYRWSKVFQYFSEVWNWRSSEDQNYWKNLVEDPKYFYKRSKLFSLSIFWSWPKMAIWSKCEFWPSAKFLNSFDLLQKKLSIFCFDLLKLDLLTPLEYDHIFICSIVSIQVWGKHRLM